MAIDRLALQTLLEKGSDEDLVREMTAFVAHRLILKTAVRHTHFDVTARNGGHFQLLRSLTERVRWHLKA